MTLPKPAYVRFNGEQLTDQGRSSVEIDPEIIERRIRTATGRLRKQHIAIKRSFSLSYEFVPQKDASTVDQKHAGAWIINFLRTTTGNFTLGLLDDDLTVQNYNVVITGYSHSVQKRWDEYYYDISIELEEV